jgi:hypothetical protein
LWGLSVASLSVVGSSLTSLVASGSQGCVGIGRCIGDGGESVLVGVGKLLAPACCIAVKPHAVGINTQHANYHADTNIYSQLQHPYLPSCVPSSSRRRAATRDTCSSTASQTPAHAVQHNHSHPHSRAIIAAPWRAFGRQRRSQRLRGGARERPALHLVYFAECVLASELLNARADALRNAFQLSRCVSLKG